ncbi:VOC family protein [Sphingosinicella sp. YJ22]|uniref:VOC family protein n=1 Tax=Sphingosinicella sp. YJ22 TaxID=1104780 RepID=UPI0014083EAE|nr:VOC family protein [Sphingosinicella sp. YJ22]
MATPPGSFIWYELLTTDLDGARDFYGAVVGLVIPAEPTPGPMDYRMIGTPGGETVGGTMQLTPAMSEGGARPGWFGYVGVDDVDATVTKIAAAGGQVKMPPTDIPQAGRIAMVADPQGAPFYVMRPTPPPGAEDTDSCVFHPEKAGHVAWNELHARDGANAFDFYADQLGWEKSDAMDMGPMGTYQMFKVGGTDQAIGGMMTSPEMPQPTWLYYFNVPDIDETLERIKANGGKVNYGPGEIPGGYFIIQGNDPQGAMFAVVGPRKGAQADAA